MGEQDRDEVPTLMLDPEPPPLRLEEGGVVRVGRGRITLDLVVEQYENGMTPEDMVRAYDTLRLADAYGVIAYYLRHRDAVRAYLERRQREAGELQKLVESVSPQLSRKELQARLKDREASNAPAGQ